MPAHHEYVFDRFVVSPRRRKISAQPCTHKNCGMTFRDLPIAEASVSAPVCTTPNPEWNSPTISKWTSNEFHSTAYSLIHAEILVPCSHKVINRFEFAATKLCALYNWTETLCWHGRDSRWLFAISGKSMKSNRFWWQSQRKWGIWWTSVAYSKNSMGI